MATPTERLVAAIRTWASENGEADYDVVHWAQLYLGWPYENVNKNPALEAMTPVERARRSMAEHKGHPTLKQLEHRIEALKKHGVWEPWIVSSLARAFSDELDKLADAEAIRMDRMRLIEDLDRFAADAESRREWVAEVRQRQIADGIPIDDLATDSSVDDFVTRAKTRLQPLTATEVSERQRRAQSWRRIAADLLDFATESHRALLRLD
jgi:hypothetical protein